MKIAYNISFCYVLFGAVGPSLKLKLYPRTARNITNITYVTELEKRKEKPLLPYPGHSRLPALEECTYSQLEVDFG
jgi:hypothetical protein